MDEDVAITMNLKRLPQSLTHQNLSFIGSFFFKSQFDNVLEISNTKPTNQNEGFLKPSSSVSYVK
jgi:hypothetical protein